jgi:hypothetical protein
MAQDKISNFEVQLFNVVNPSFYMIAEISDISFDDLRI